MGSKSGQPQQQQKSGYSGGKSGQPQNRNPGFQMGGSGKQNKSGWQPQSPNYGKSGQPQTGMAGMQGFNQQMQPQQQQGGNRWNQGYANLTGNPNPTMPPQVGAPQTGAFPYPQQPQAQPQQAQDPTQAAPAQPQAAPAQPQAAQPMSVAPNSKSMWQPTQEFYDAVTKTLGEKKMATQGQYDQGWNKEVGGDSRARGREDAKRMEQALGRPLTRQEVSQLEQRQTGWRFVPPGIDFATGKPHGPALKPEDYWKPMSQEDQQAQFGLAAPKKSYP